MDRRNTTFISGLFRSASKFVRVDADDPFISPEVLKNCSSLCATDESGLPNYVLSDPNITINDYFTEDVWSNCEKVQIQRENKEREADAVERKKKEESEAADRQFRKPLDLQVDRVFNKHQFFVKKSCPVMIPYKSSLTHEEHKAYLRAFVRFRIRPALTPAEAAEHEQYLSLQHRVYDEQCRFIQFSYQVASAQLSAYNTVPEIVTSYINQYVQHRSKRAVRYKRSYVQEQQVPLCPQDPTKRFSNLSFTHLGHLLSLGTVPWFKIPNPHNLNRLPLDESVARAQPPGQSETPSTSIIHKTPVSEDHNAAYLAQKHRANIVISTSALTVLVDNYGPSFDKEWDIPVVVKSFQIEDADGNESSHRVVFIDKPLPQKTWTPLEKKRQFYKKSALATLTEIKKFPFLKMKSPAIFHYSAIDEGDAQGKTGPCNEPAEYDEDFFDLTAGASSDCFGVPESGTECHTSLSPTHKNKRKGKTMTNNQSPKKSKISNINAAENDHTSTGKGRVGKNLQEMDSSLTPGTPQHKSGEQEKSQAEDSPTKSSPEARATGKTRNHSPRKINTSSVKGESVSDACKILGNTSAYNSKTTGSTPRRTADSEFKTGDSSTDNVLENLLDMQDSLLKPSHVGSSGHDSKPECVQPSSSKPWSSTLKTDWAGHIKPQSCEQWSGTNVHYQLFSLGFSNTQTSNSSQPLRIIVRHNLHGLAKMRNQNKFSKAYVVFSKPENQAYFGCEVNTLSEITQQWINLLVRPNTTLLQVRVCESSGEILLTEEKDLGTVVKDGKQAHIGFSPTVPLSILHSVFSATAALSTGSYLLHHRLNTKAFILLMKAIDFDTPTHLQTLDLHHYYSGASALTRPYTVPPWLAIDTHILTPFHLKHHKIPATFPMANPHKKLTKEEKLRINERAKNKVKIVDLDKPVNDGTN